LKKEDTKRDMQKLKQHDKVVNLGQI